MQKIKSLTSAMLIFLILFSNAGAAGVPDWSMKVIQVDNPYLLLYSLDFADECPITKTEGHEIVESVFYQSEIIPLRQFELEKLYLSISLDCMNISSSPQDIYSFNLAIKFQKFEINPLIGIASSHPFGQLGEGDEGHIIDQIKSTTANALAEFVESIPESLKTKEKFS